MKRGVIRKERGIKAIGFRDLLPENGESLNIRLNLSFQEILYDWHIQQEGLLRILERFHRRIRFVQRL